MRAMRVCGQRRSPHNKQSGVCMCAWGVGWMGACEQKATTKRDETRSRSLDSLFSFFFSSVAAAAGQTDDQTNALTTSVCVCVTRSDSLFQTRFGAYGFMLLYCLCTRYASVLHPAERTSHPKNQCPSLLLLLAPAAAAPPKHTPKLLRTRRKKKENRRLSLLPIISLHMTSFSRARTSSSASIVPGVVCSELFSVVGCGGVVVGCGLGCACCVDWVGSVCW